MISRRPSRMMTRAFSKSLSCSVVRWRDAPTSSARSAWVTFRVKRMPRESSAPNFIASSIRARDADDTITEGVATEGPRRVRQQRRNAEDFAGSHQTDQDAFLAVLKRE